MNNVQPWISQTHLSGVFYTGEWRQASKFAEAIEPASSDSIGKVGLATPEEMRNSSKAARKAQVDWAAGSYETRVAVLRKAAEVATRQKDEIVAWLIRESGSIRPKAEFEVAVSIKALWEASSAASQAIGQVLPSNEGRLSLARRRPVGVVGIISPFNFPLYLAMRAVAPALAMGNAVVLKPDPRTALSGGVVLARIFEEAGLPAGVFHMLPGDGAAGASLCEDPNISMIQFTGSTPAGRKVGESASRNLKKVSLELGGKNSILVLDDADLELAVKNVVWSVYLHQGQICMSAGRVIVHGKIAEEFIRRLTEHASKMSVGNPFKQNVALGPMINLPQVERALSIVDDSVRGGAKLALGGKSDGLFFQPTILTQVKKGMRAYSEEIFAPVAVVITVDSDEEAIRVANDTEYGLSAAILSQNTGRALKISEQIHAGLIHINDSTVNDEVVNPFGGVGASGNGASIGGASNWEEFTQWQWLTVKSEAPAYPL
jgi:benzaldehyde dehydrogenase (NAD)